MLIALLRLSSLIVNRIPKAFTDSLADFLGLLFYTLIRFRRNIILENLRLAFGKEKTESEIRDLALRNYQHYGRVLFEIWSSISWTEADFRERTIFEGLEHIQKNLERGKGGIFLGSHLGNWEFALATPAAHGLAFDVIVKESKSPLGQKMLDWYRKRHRLGVFLESNTTRDILRSLSQGRFIGFIIDQFMGPPIGLPVKFFGKEAGTAAALAIFSERKDLNIFPAYNYRDSEGKLHTVIEPEVTYPSLSDDKDTRLFEKTQVYNNILERLVRQHPEQWLWLHRRWKSYRGEPKWKPVAQYVSAVLAGVLLISCVGKESTTPTGITLPPDLSIVAPEFLPPHPVETIPSSEIPQEAVKMTPEKTGKKKTKKQLPKLVDKTPIPVTATPKNDDKHFHVIPSDKLPFEVGERVEVDLRWLAIPAGRAVMEVREGPVMNGRPTFLLWGNALSSRIVDAIYHVDNTAESFIDREGFIPYKFLLHMFETQQKKETRVAFDHTQGKAYYWAKRISQRWGDQNIDRVDALIPGAKDLWSAIYFARYLSYKLNEKQSFPVYENGQNWNVELLPVGYELVTTTVGAFQCWKILVKVSLNNVFKPMGDVYMWLSDDSKKHLVKFDAKIKIGSLYGVLTSLREH